MILTMKSMKTTMKGGLTRWDRKLESQRDSMRFHTLFDTGADSANYIYSYHLDKLRKIYNIPTFWIEEPVRFGDNLEQVLYEAVMLDVSFKDPTNPRNKIRRKHIFKVIRLDKEPKNGTPMILGLPTIASFYLEFLIRALRFYYSELSIPLLQTVDDEIKRLRIRSKPKKSYTNNDLVIKHCELIVDDTANDNATKAPEISSKLKLVFDYENLNEDVKEELRKHELACINQDNALILNQLNLDRILISDELFEDKPSVIVIDDATKDDKDNKDETTNKEETKFDIDDYMSKTIPPWSHLIGEAPEELDSYIPCCNTGLFNYLSTTYDEALAKYFADCKKNTSPEAWHFVEDILYSELAINRFCPREWTGMIGVDPIQLRFSPEWEAIKTAGLGPKGKAFVNEKMRHAYETEFERMLGYMYIKSSSSTASRIIVADKATPPYIRICGDYRIINKYILLPQIVIPNIRHEINKAQGYYYFIDLDLKNGFHNLTITEESAMALAIATEWGLFQPKFMPEGVRSAPQEFQRVMKQIFDPVNDFTIVIWDNLLVLCRTLEELREKFIKILEICAKHNVILSMAKTHIGYTHADFFGYIVRCNSIELSQSRKEGIQSLMFFKNQKGAQSFLGSCNFFKDFVPNYSKHTSLLHDMVKKDFNWNRSTWTEDYEKAFENLKVEIQNSLVMHFPDYSKLWILRTDCSKDALGAILFQVGPDGVYEPIALVSQKLSDQAKNWAAVKLEAYAVYFAIKKLAYYLLGHTFVVEMDHANLVTMESSEQYIIQRWRCYLENFNFRIRHISGKQNLLADFQSRMYSFFETLDADTFQQYNDPMFTKLLQDYDHLCATNHHEFNLLASLFDDNDEDTSELTVIVRDDVKTVQCTVPSLEDVPQVLMIHDPSLSHNYIQTMDEQNQTLFIDAVHVTTRSQAKLLADNDVVTPPLITNDVQETLSSEEEEGQDKSIELPLALNDEPIFADSPVPVNAEDDLKDILDADLTQELKEEILETQKKVALMMKNLHGSRHLHSGADRMYKDICKLYPGHRLPQSFFRDFVSKCAICQKARLQKDKVFLERIRSLKENPQPRSAVCIDRVSVSPASKRGNTTAIVIADLFTRLAKVYASSEYTSDSVANALKDFLITYGSYDVLQSDPGSDILGGAVDAINDRWKLKRKISLVDRHESNGNERLIQELLRHLRALVNDERAMDVWDDVDYLGFVNFCINDSINSETGLTPYIATFGDRDAAYFELPEVNYDVPKSAKSYVENLNKNLEKIRQINREYQLKIHEQRTAKTPAITHNQFRKGDLIWYRRPERIDKDGKLFFRNKGPFRVTSMRHNDVECTHIVTNQVKVFHVTNVMPVNLDTPYEELYEAAKRDHDQWDVISILGWKGDIMRKSSIEFLLEFEDGEQTWRSYDNDLKNNIVVKQYINDESNNILMPLRYSLEEWNNIRKQLNKEPIESFNKIYLDWRSYPLAWRTKVGLPELPSNMTYVFQVIFKKYTNKSKTACEVQIVTPRSTFTINNTWMKQCGSIHEFNPETMVLIDEELVKRYPKISEEDLEEKNI